MGCEIRECLKIKFILIFHWSANERVESCEAVRDGEKMMRKTAFDFSFRDFKCNFKPVMKGL